MDKKALTLAGFYAARLDEREAAARELIDGTGMARIARMFRPGAAPLIAPGQQQLREVEAGRKILTLARINADLVAGQVAEDSSPDNPSMVSAAASTLTIGLVLMALAAAYGDHPDYDQAWNPERALRQPDRRKGQHCAGR